MKYCKINYNLNKHNNNSIFVDTEKDGIAGITPSVSVSKYVIKQKA